MTSQGDDRSLFTSAVTILPFAVASLVLTFLFWATRLATHAPWGSIGNAISGLLIAWVAALVALRKTSWLSDESEQAHGAGPFRTAATRRTGHAPWFISVGVAAPYFVMALAVEQLIIKLVSQHHIQWVALVALFSSGYLLRMAVTHANGESWQAEGRLTGGVVGAILAVALLIGAIVVDHTYIATMTERFGLQSEHVIRLHWLILGETSSLLAMAGALLVGALGVHRSRAYLLDEPKS